MENKDNNTNYRIPQKQTGDWTLLGQGKTIDRTLQDPPMKGRHWTINYGFSSGKSYDKLPK